MSVLKFLLLPLAWLYNLGTGLRNHLFNIGHFHSFQFETVVISVGNLNVGGSGKTPMIEYLVRLLSPKYKLAVLSRGYGRATSGYRLAGEKDNAQSIGDEPFQMYLKYGDKTKVVVGEERALAIPTILNDCPDVQVILLDDAYQHRTVVPHFSILLTEYSKPFYKDMLLPFGRLRESRKGARRADVVVFTKCPENLSVSEMEMMKTEVKKYSQKHVYFSFIRYQQIVPFDGISTLKKKAILVSGIARSSLLERYVSENFELVKHFDFQDHHHYSTEEIKKIQSLAIKHDAIIITTEKDKSKLILSGIQEVVDRKLWFEIPVESIILNNGLEFDAMIEQAIETKLATLKQAGA